MMPDNQMPYGDFNNLPQMQQIPDPSMAFNNFSYAQNNAMIMNSGQSNMAAALQTAQYNFHNHMQTVLQGTMASAMAIYNTGKAIHEKAREAHYNDQLLGNGVYALERSSWRDIAWGSGLAGSELGRALKIGGRRPEYMTEGEYAHQMHRSYHHRMADWGDSFASGTLSALSSAASMIPGVGFLGGIAIDATVGMISKPYFERRQAIRDFQMFSEMADVNQGVGQRRMSRAASGRLGGMLYDEDNPMMSYLPLIGERFRPDINKTQLKKDMTQLGLLRDIGVDDVDKIKAEVDKTAAIIDKFAGLANTTRDHILKLKGSFKSMGINDEAALGSITKAHLATGIDLNTLAGSMSQYGMMGLAAGYNKTTIGNSGVQEIASIKALQEAGIIDRAYDPASLAQQRMGIAVGFGQSGWGKVVRYGGGNIGQTMSYFASRGGGNSAMGYALSDLEYFNQNEENADPLANFRAGAQMAYKRLGMGALGMAKTPEEKRMMFDAIFGIDKLGVGASASSAARAQTDKDGIVRGSTLHTDKIKLTTLTSAQENYAFGIMNRNDVISNSKITNKTEELYSKHESKVASLHSAILSGNEQNIKLATEKLKDFGVSDDDINAMLKEHENNLNSSNKWRTAGNIITAAAGGIVGVAGIATGNGFTQHNTISKSATDAKANVNKIRDILDKDFVSGRTDKNAKLYNKAIEVLRNTDDEAVKDLILTGSGKTTFTRKEGDKDVTREVTKFDLAMLKAVDNGTLSREDYLKITGEFSRNRGMQTTIALEAIQPRIANDIDLREENNYFATVSKAYKGKTVDRKEFDRVKGQFREDIKTLRSKDGVKFLKDHASDIRYNFQVTYGDELGDQLFSALQKTGTSSKNLSGIMSTVFKDADKQLGAYDVEAAKQYNLNIKDDGQKAMETFNVLVQELITVLKKP